MIRRARLNKSGVREQEVDTAARRVALRMLRLFMSGLFRPLFASVDVHTIHTNTRHPLIRAGHLQDC
jgi:hypothetical protein